MWLLLALGALAIWLGSRGYAVKVTDNANVALLAPAMVRALPVIDQVSQAVIGRDSIITSGYREEPGQSSLHAVGLAVDLRDSDLTSAQVQDYAKALASTLGPPYQVVIETAQSPGSSGPHIHVEYDVQNGYAQGSGPFTM